MPCGLRRRDGKQLAAVQLSRPLLDRDPQDVADPQRVKPQLPDTQGAVGERVVHGGVHLHRHVAGRLRGKITRMRRPAGSKPLCHISGLRPCGWTGSGCCFDCLLGVVIFELHGAEIAQR